MESTTLALEDVGGALALCDLRGELVGATPTARAILHRMSGAECALPRGLWEALEASPSGEAVVWSSPEGAGQVLGCTRYPVRDARALLVMREISNKQEHLAQKLQRQRARTMEMLVFLLAHDLRAPLATILFNLDSLRNGGGLLEPEFCEEALDASLEATSQLRQTIDALVDLVRIGPPVASDLDVRNVIGRVVALTRPLIRHANHEVVVAIDPVVSTVRGNSLAVQQILVNLVVNAAESTTVPMRITIAAAPAQLAIDGREVPAVRMRVHDGGPGITHAVRGRLFQPFFTTKESGAGLGLALARDAAVEGRGTLEEVPVERGACFEVVLPVEGL